MIPQPGQKDDLGMSGSNLASRASRRLRWEASRLSLAWNDVVYTRWHDLTRTRRLRPVPGSQPLHRKVAIYAIYPTSGVLPSHLVALRHLLAQGYAALVVANLPLSEQDLARLLPLCWQVAQRRNFGFDIGGYRAALLWLGERLARLDRLVLTNDSIWFPVGQGRDWLAVADGLCEPGAGAAEPDLIGAVSNGGMAGSGHAGSWQIETAAADFHYCSFALSFGPAILRDPDFLTFWRRMRLTDRKVQIVERGEVAISRWAIGRGHRHKSCWDLQGLAERLAGQDLDRLVLLIDALIIPEDRALRERRAAFRASAAVQDKTAVVNFLLEVIALTGPAYALPAWTVDEDGFGFLKKSPLRLDQQGRACTLALLGPHPDFLAEAQAVPLQSLSA